MEDRRDIVLTPEQQNLKNASIDLIAAYRGQGAAAARLGTRQQRISDCCNINMAPFLRIDEVMILESETHGTTGHPQVTRSLARHTGYILVKQRQAPPDEADLLKLVAAQAQESSDITTGLCGALADGKVSAAEARRIRGEIVAAQEALAAMDAAMEMIEREDGQ